MERRAERRVMIEEGEVGQTVPLSPEAAHHLTRVLRMAPGEAVVAFTAAGKEFLACVADVSEEGATLRLERLLLRPLLSEQVAVRLCFSPPRAQRADWLVEKATELGVARLQPLIFERTQGERRAQAARRTDRWLRLAREAARQSERGDVPEIAPPRTWRQYLQEEQQRGTRLLAHADQPALPLMPLLTSRPLEELSRVDLVIGPEGGLTSYETDQGRQAGFDIVRLGPTILRTETAAVCAAATVIFTATGRIQSG